MKKKIRRHFRIYFRNNHPAYIVDEEGKLFLFHRVTHSKTSGGKKNWKKKNPLKVGKGEYSYIVKREEKDNKKRFSPFELETKPGIDINYPKIKNAGRSQKLITSNQNVNNNCPSTNIKTNTTNKGKNKK